MGDQSGEMNIREMSLRERLAEYSGKIATHEENNIKKIQDAALSAFGSDPINYALEGPSGSGKTHVILAALKPFPEEYKLILRGMSPTAFYREKGQLCVYDDKEEKYVTQIQNKFTGTMCDVAAYKNYLAGIVYDKGKDKKFNIDGEREELEDLQKKIWTLVVLKDKIIVFLDSQAEKVLLELAPILSHDTYYTKLRVSDPNASGKWETRGIVIEGWPAIIYATSSGKGILSSQDINSRFQLSEPVTSSEKVEKAKNMIAEQAFGWCAPTDKELPKLKEDLNDLIYELKNTNYQTILPIAPERLSKLINSDSPIVMRRLKTLLTHIQAECYFNLNDRVKFVVEYENGISKSYVLVSFEDLKNAINTVFADNSIQAEVAGLPKSDYEFYMWILNHSNDNFILSEDITPDAALGIKAFRTFKSRKLHELCQAAWLKEIDVRTQFEAPEGESQVSLTGKGKKIAKNAKGYNLLKDRNEACFIDCDISCYTSRYIIEKSEFEAYFQRLVTSSPKSISIAKQGEVSTYKIAENSDKDSISITDGIIELKKVMEEVYVTTDVTSNVTTDVTSNVTTNQKTHIGILGTNVTTHKSSIKMNNIDLIDASGNPRELPSLISPEGPNPALNERNEAGGANTEPIITLPSPCTEFDVCQAVLKVIATLNEQSPNGVVLKWEGPLGKPQWCGIQRLIGGSTLAEIDKAVAQLLTAGDLVEVREGVLKIVHDGNNGSE